LFGELIKVGHFSTTVVDPRLFQTLELLRFASHQEGEVKDTTGLHPLPLDSNIVSNNNVLGTSMIVDVEVYTTLEEKLGHGRVVS